MSPWWSAVGMQGEPGLPAHHVPDGLEWLPFLGLVLVVLAMVSAIATRSRQRSGGERADGD
jgi:hypothetical protein